MILKIFCALDRHRAEQLFNNVPSSKLRSVHETGEDYRSLLLFIEDHRKVIQLVIY